MLVKRFWMFKLLKQNIGNTEKSKKEISCPSELSSNYRGYRGSHPEILEYLLWKIQEHPWETAVFEHFDLILAGKSSTPRTATFEIIWGNRRDGFLS